MTIRVPYKLWARAKCVETGKSEDSLRTRLRKKDFNGYRQVFAGTKIISVEINCNRTGHLFWLGVKMEDKLKKRECACGHPGIAKNSDHSWTCGDCQIKEAKYSRCITSLAARRERNKNENEIAEQEAQRLQFAAPAWD